MGEVRARLRRVGRMREEVREGLGESACEYEVEARMRGRGGL